MMMQLVKTPVSFIFGIGEMSVGFGELQCYVLTICGLFSYLQETKV